MPWGVVASAVVGGVVQSDNARKAAHQQQDAANAALEGQQDALAEQVRQADELLAFNKEQFAYNKERLAKTDALSEKVINQQMNLSDKAGVRADEAYDFYKNTGRPVVEQSINEAKNFDNAANIGAARGRANADVQQAFDNSAQQAQRTLARMGVNPSSGRFLALQQRLQADRALAQAGAETNAEQGVRTQAIGMRQQASNLAQGFPAQSMGQAGQSAGFGSSATGISSTANAQSIGLSAAALNGMQAGGNMFGSVAAGYGNIYGNAMNAANNQSAAGASNMAGWGQLAGQGLGMLSKSGGFNFNFGGASALTDSGAGFFGGATPYAEGGLVKGPGTGTSDSVPARLSNGEYVINADTVRAVGVNFLDRLQAKHSGKSNLRSAV